MRYIENSDAYISAFPEAKPREISEEIPAAKKVTTAHLPSKRSAIFFTVMDLFKKFNQAGNGF